ncbi:hypothetical protein HZS_6862 [Henneguya salminicola]|nr:hypothetical protein HZS_6862 [Henneguya salminicola]
MLNDHKNERNRNLSSFRTTLKNSDFEISKKVPELIQKQVDQILIKIIKNSLNFSIAYKSVKLEPCHLYSSLSMMKLKLYGCPTRDRDTQRLLHNDSTSIVKQSELTIPSFSEICKIYLY